MTTHLPLRWGLMGTARINRKIIPALRASARCALTAVASRDLAKATAYAKEFGIARVFDGYDALIADPDIDAVYISLPNSLHAEWSIKAAQFGKHVLCEKPLALSVEDVDAIEAAARANGVIIAEAFMYRHHPQTLALKQLIDSGAIGPVRLIRGSFTFQIAAPHHIRLDPALGGGSIWDLGCYPISFARAMLGAEPVEVSGMAIIGSDSGVDEAFLGSLRFADGALAQFDCGFRAPYRVGMDIVGADGMIVVPAPFAPGARPVIHIGPSIDALETRPMPAVAHLYQDEIEDLTDAALGLRPQRVSLADSRENVRVIRALLASAARAA